ncbi:MAG: signal peptidase II [Steroidobacter sp.]
MRFARRMLLIIVTFICCVGCDQVSKIVIRNHLAIGETYSYLHDTVRLTHSENSGAFLSLGDKLPEHTRVMLFSVMVLVISAAALSATFFMKQLNQYQIIGLALIASGGFGNWIDRVTNSGHVTDFMNIGIGWLRTGIFNVADVALMAGLALCLFATKEKLPASPDSMLKSTRTE